MYHLTKDSVLNIIHQNKFQMNYRITYWKLPIKKLENNIAKYLSDH